MKAPTSIKTEAGTPVYMADKPCTACGCFQAFVFECNCGAVHADVCFNCGAYAGIDHKPLPQEGNGWAKPCSAGKTEHEHTHTH